jgi:hypothetical protein
MRNEMLTEFIASTKDSTRRYSKMYGTCPMMMMQGLTSVAPILQKYQGVEDACTVFVGMCACVCVCARARACTVHKIK